MKHFSTMAYSVMKGDEYVSLDDVAFSGPCFLTCKENDFFGGKDSKMYFSALLDTPTWGEVFIESMKAQQNTLDFHHSYLEGLRKVGYQDGVTILAFQLGS